MTVIVNEKDIIIERLVLGPYETNCYIVVCVKTRDSLVIDAPADAPAIIERLANTSPKYILLTHDHFDHTGTMTSLRARLKAPLGCHIADSTQLKTPPEIILNEGDTIPFGALFIDVIHTPGHTPGSLCFKVGKYMFVGDTLFPGGPGRTETPEDFKRILESIQYRIFRRRDDTIVYPGHGDPTTIKKSKDEFAAFNARPHRDDLYGDVTWAGS